MLAFHAIFGAYGFWLPNDPRGSGSNYVGQGDLWLVAGDATEVSTRRSVAAQPHDRVARESAKQWLSRRPVKFTGLQARAIGRGLSTVIAKCGYQVFACSIMPEHVHLVIAGHQHSPRALVGNLKRAATISLVKERLHPFRVDQNGELPSCWGAKGWNVYLDTVNEVQQRIEYVI